MGDGPALPACPPAVRAARLLSLLALAAVLPCSFPATAARFGVPPGPGGGDPPGWLILVNSDTGDPVVSDGWGDVAHFMTFAIEVADDSFPLVVEIYDPGLHDPGGGDAQLDLNLNPAGGTGTIRYVLFAPDDSVLADSRFGADTAATDRQLVELHRRNVPALGLYHLVAEIEESAGDTQDIAVFGLSVPNRQVWTLGLTTGSAAATLLGDATQGGATIEEPVRVHPLVSAVSPGSDPFGPVCGLQFVNFDMEAPVLDMVPPVTELRSRSGYVFPTADSLPSGDSRWFATDLGGIDAGPLSSDDQGVWTWSFSRLDEADLEDLMSNIDPIDVNAFSVQVLDHSSPSRDFSSWADLPSRPPWVVFNADHPRRLYLPEDDWSAPDRARLGHSARVVAGFPVVSEGETSTLEVTVSVVNPFPYPLRALRGETHVAPGPELGDPVLVSDGGFAVTLIGRDIEFSGDVAAGETRSLSYVLDLSPASFGRGFVTGDGVDFVSAPGAPTVAVYDAPYTDPFSFELPRETLGPVCQLEYEAIVPPCAGRATILPSGPIETCPGSEVVLDGTSSEIFNCDSIGGVAIYQWSVNGMVVDPFPGADPTRAVVPYADDTWTLEIACSTDPSCVDEASVSFELYEAPEVDAGPDRELCLGDDTDLAAVVMSANPPVTDQQWSTDPPGQPGDGARSPSITVAPDTTTIYSFSATDARGCVGTGSVVLTVRTPEVAIAPPVAELCPGESVELVASPGFVDYLWSSEPPGLPGDGTAGDRVDAADVGATWTVVASDDLGCTAQASAQVVMSVGPSPVITPAVPQFCVGGSIGLVGEPGYVDYLWSTLPPGLPGDGDRTPNLVATALGATYTLTVTDARGCSGSSEVVTTEKPPFEPAIEPPSPELCGSGDSIALIGEPGFVEYLWTTAPPGLPGDGSSSPMLLASAEGTYTLEVLDTENCRGIGSVVVVASPDAVPGPLGPSLRVEKAGADDLRLSWIDLAEAVSGYDVVSLPCDGDLDGTCDQDPTRAALDALPTAPPGVPAGIMEKLLAGAQDTPSDLDFYKVRGLSPCSSTPGPYL